MTLRLWTLTVASADSAARFAARAEKAGWAGMAVVDSQNLSGDPYVALALAAEATQRLGVATGVTNPVTRHPAVTAAAIASVQRVSGGRAVLGIGRGDSALAHLGRSPATVKTLERYLQVLQTYLRGDGVAFGDLAFHERTAPPIGSLDLADAPDESRLAWLGGAVKVPVEVAATGPRVIAAAARHADRVMFALGADPDRLRWGIEEARSARREAGLDPDALALGAYLNLVCHPQRETARDLVRGGLATFARFSVMHGSAAGPVSPEQREVFEGVHATYDMRRHTRSDSEQAALLTPGFIDRFAVVGPPDHCLRRLEEIAALGIDKVTVIGPTAGADPREARRAVEELASGVLPAFAAPAGA